MKRVLISVMLISAIVIVLTPAYAQEEVQNDPFVNQVVNTSEKINEFNDNENKTAYLQNEWNKVLEKNAAGRILITISNLLKRANPLIEKIIGVSYGLKWEFLFALILWFTIAGFVWKPLTALTENNALAIIASFLIASLAGFLGLIKKVIGLLSLAIKNWWTILIALAGAVFLFILFERLGKVIALKIKQAKDKDAKAKEKEDREILGLEAQAAEKMRHLNISGPTNTKANDYGDGISGPGLD